MDDTNLDDRNGPSHKLYESSKLYHEPKEPQQKVQQKMNRDQISGRAEFDPKPAQSASKIASRWTFQVELYATNIDLLNLNFDASFNSRTLEVVTITNS